jgi:exosome complex RNA-binding protein Rrp42 (RNase PH superfamily)
MSDTSFGERIWIVQGVEQDLRTDGRSRATYRPLGVEANIIAQADGSARLHLGATDVLVGVKVGAVAQQHWQSMAATAATPLTAALATSEQSSSFRL